MPPIDERKRALDFLISEANGWRSRVSGLVRQAANSPALQAGTLLVFVPQVGAVPDHWIPATNLTGGTATGILMYPMIANPGAIADSEAAIIVRDCEVAEPYLEWATWTDAERAAAAASLSLNHVIVRKGVLRDQVVMPPIFP
jgi:hypothetical protein